MITTAQTCSAHDILLVAILRAPELARKIVNLSSHKR